MTLTPVVTNIPTIVLESTRIDSVASTLEAIDTNDPSIVLEDCGDTQEQPPPEVPVVSDALVASKIVFMDSLSAGIAQSFGDVRGDGGIRNFGRYDDIVGVYDYFETGGRNGGGYVVSTVSDGSLRINIASTLGGRYYLGTNETPPTQGGITTIHDLKGKTISGPTPLQTLGNHAIVEVMPDHTLRVVANSVVLGTPTAFTVPSSGWFALESYLGVAPDLLTSGGFVISNLYVPGSPAVGVPIIRSIGYNAYNGSSDHDIRLHFIHIPQNTGFGGMAIHGPYGTVKKWMYDLILTNGWPSAPGDKTESIRTFEYYEPIGLELDGVTVVNFGPPGGMHWGEVERWKNVRSKTHKAYKGDEQLTVLTEAGEISISTNRWLSGPFYPDDSFDPIVRNTFVNEATDFYKTTIEDVGIVEIEAIGTFALSGARSWRESWGVLATQKLWWNMCGPHPYDPTHLVSFGWPNNFVQSSTNYGSCNAVHEQLIKTSAGDILVTRKGVAMAGSGEWRAELGYTLGPDLMKDRDPSTNQRWLPNNLPQVGVRGSFALNDALDTPATGDDRWNQFDIGQLGLDIAGRSQIITVTSLLVQPPVAAYKTVSFGTTSGTLVVYDISVDFNGDTSTLISGIVSRIMDWGDGTSESLPVGVVGGIATGQVTHHYDANGATYIAKLTVTNAQGKTNFTTKSFVTAIGAITASFTAGVDSGDATGKTINFVDTSTVVDGTVVSRLWNFGDGNTSTAQNPTHIYSGYGIEHVTLTVTGNHGQVGNTSQDIDVEAPGAGGCGLSTLAIANTLGVQGDDYHGGNPPFISYANTASFDNYYTGGTFREWYDTGFSSAGVDHAIDGSVQWNGHNTFREDFGAGHFGAGWFTLLTDDDPTTEHYYSSAGQWIRRIFKADAGVMSDGSATAFASGLELLAFAHSFIMNRQGNIILDVSRKATGPGDPNTGVSNVICADSAVFGTGGFIEMIVLYEGDNVGHTVRVRVWIGTACSLTGVSPTADFTVTDWRATLTTDFLEFDNWIFTPAGAIKSIWNGLAETVKLSQSANPYNVSLT